jgi:hypothetical protein
MTKVIRSFWAPVPPERQQRGIKILVWEEDPEHTGGYFLFLCEALEKGLEDIWYEHLDQVFTHAQDEFGVTLDDWQPLKS